MDDELLATTALIFCVVLITLIPLVLILIFEAYHRGKKPDDDHREHP